MQAVPLFATPIVLAPDAISAAERLRLRDAVLALEAAEPGIDRSNHGGWHSPSDLLARPAFAPLGQVLVASARSTLDTLASRHGVASPPVAGWHLQLWAMVMRRGDLSAPHDHADAHLAGVLTLDDGGAPAGELTFLDPRRTRLPWSPLDPEAVAFPPVPGRLVWFPAGLQHWVTPHGGDRPRVTLSVNVRARLG